MNSFDFSDYDYESPPVANNKGVSQKSLDFESDISFDFSTYEYPEEQSKQIDKIEDEGLLKSTARTALQVPQGMAELTQPGILGSLWQAYAHGESELDPYEEALLSEASLKAGKEFTPEKYEESRQQALSMLPTVSNIARGIESETGIPLEPKTKLQKGARFATQVASGIPNPSASAPKGYTFRGLNTGLPNPVLGVGAAGIREGLIQAGLPEPIADLTAIATIKPTSATSGKLSVGPVKKESGLTKRKYEGIEKPTEISQRTLQKINEKTEKEFRNLTDKIIKETPINETYSTLRENPQFKQNTREAFEDVSKLAENITEKVSTKELISEINSLSKSKPKSGFLPSEYEKTHNKFLKEMIKETPVTDASASDLLSQFRKNNRSYGEIKEPGQSYAYNQAKRDALRDYNIGIEKIIEKKFKGSEFPKTFKEINERWSKIMDAEAISEFLDDTFDGKIDFKNAKDLFEKNGMDVPFKRAMGEKGFNNFKTLVNDLVTAEKGYKLLRKAKEMGYGDIAKTVGAYAIHPEAALYKTGYDLLKGGYKTMFDMLMDKPEISISWDRGINAFKAGNFKVAEKELSKVMALEKAKESGFGNKKSSEINLTGMGKGITDNFYEGIFNSLKEGKDTFSGVKDPLIQKAKKPFSEGKIKTIEDLKKFAQTLSNK